MAFGKTAAGLILAAAAWAQPVEFTVRHEHLRKGCSGVMTAGEIGLTFTALKGHAWTWKYEEIQELILGPDRIHVLTYQDNKLRLGADRAYDFTGRVPAADLYRLWSAHLDQRFVAAVGQVADPPLWSLPAKLLHGVTGSQGVLAVSPEVLTWSAPGDSRTWRISDIDRIASSGPFQLTIATLRQEFNFQLKQPLTEARYNRLWLEIERKNGKLQ